MKLKNIRGWQGFELVSKDLSVGIVPSLGGRIMSLEYLGHELLFVDACHQGETFNPAHWNNLIQAKKSLGFRIWGGDKTWIAPQKDWVLGIPPLDLDAAPYSLSWDNEEAVMTSPVCRETGIQVTRRVKVNDGKVYLVEEICNRSSSSIHKGLWNVTQIQRPCSFQISCEEEKIRSYHYEDKTLSPYPGSLKPKKGSLTIDCRDASLFKVGGISTFGKVLIKIYSGDQEIYWEKDFSYNPQAAYAHHSNVEVFNSPFYPYAEIELHAPFGELRPQETTVLEQIWKISSCPS